MTMLLGAWHHQAERTTALVSSTLSSRALKWRKERERGEGARGEREGAHRCERDEETTVSVERASVGFLSLFLLHTRARTHRLHHALTDEF